MLFLLRYSCCLLRLLAPSVAPPVEMAPPPPAARPSLDARHYELTDLIKTNDLEECKFLLDETSANLKLKTKKCEELTTELFEAKKKVAQAEQEKSQLKVMILSTQKQM